MIIIRLKNYISILIQVCTVYCPLHAMHEKKTFKGLQFFIQQEVYTYENQIVIMISYNFTEGGCCFCFVSMMNIFTNIYLILVDVSVFVSFK